MFQSEALQFLRELKENNDREWFQPRKAEFERLLKQPMEAAVAEVNTALSKAGFGEYVTDPKKAIYRIYRDTRFSPDKRPYKTHIGALLWHRALGKDGGAALYFHVSAEEFLVAGGLYMSPPEIMRPVREYLAEHYEQAEAMTKSPGVRRLFPKGVEGESLKRPPKGWHAEHPAVDWLRRKHLLLETSLPAETAVEPKAAALVAKYLTAIGPFADFLNAPLLAAAKRKKRDPLAFSGGC